VAGTVAQLGLDEAGTVDTVDGDDAVSIRLLEMGFVPGTSVKVLKVAPMGDPLQLQLRGYHISLRRAEANRIRLRGTTTGPRKVE